MTLTVVVASFWLLTFVTSFDRTTSDDVETWTQRADWLKYQRLPSETVAPPPAGESADAGAVYAKWTKSRWFLQPSTRTFHLVARVPPDSLDVWHQQAFGWTEDDWRERGLPPNPSPDTEWLSTLPPGPPTDGLTEWYGDRRDMVGLDRARGIVAYRASTHDTHRRERWWWRFWDY